MVPDQEVYRRHMVMADHVASLEVVVLVEVLMAVVVVIAMASVVVVAVALVEDMDVDVMLTFEKMGVQIEEAVLVVVVVVVVAEEALVVVAVVVVVVAHHILDDRLVRHVVQHIMGTVRAEGNNIIHRKVCSTSQCDHDRTFPKFKSKP